jgi:hypothetical protein
MKTSSLLVIVALLVSLVGICLKLIFGFDNTVFLSCFICYWGMVLFSFVSLALLELVQFLKKNK